MKRAQNVVVPSAMVICDHFSRQLSKQFLQDFRLKLSIYFPACTRCHPDDLKPIFVGTCEIQILQICMLVMDAVGRENTYMSF